MDWAEHACRTRKKKEDQKGTGGLARTLHGHTMWDQREGQGEAGSARLAGEARGVTHGWTEAVAGSRQHITVETHGRGWKCGHRAGRGRGLSPFLPAARSLVPRIEESKARAPAFTTISI